MFQSLSRAFSRPLAKLSSYRKRTIALVMCLFHVLGALTSIRAILDVRTAQGAVAWARCFSSCGRAGSAWVIPIRCQVPVRSRTKVWSLTYQGSASPTEGS